MINIFSNFGIRVGEGLRLGCWVWWVLEIYFEKLSILFSQPVDLFLTIWKHNAVYCFSVKTGVFLKPDDSFTNDKCV